MFLITEKYEKVLFQNAHENPLCGQTFGVSPRNPVPRRGVCQTLAKSPR